MPQNLDLTPITLPMALRFGEEPQTEFVNNLDALNVQLIDAPDPRTIRKAVYCFVKSTWADKPVDFEAATDADLSKTMEDVFAGRALPAAMELIGLTFLVGGIDTQTVTHLIRHRAGSFAAQCTGDRWLSHERSLVPESVQNSPEIYERWKNHVREAKQLYSDMVDTKKISLMDARHVLPKCLETFYYMRMNIGDALRFIKQRQDKQIQPEEDNIIAALMAREILRVFPEAHVAINLREPAWHYIKTFRNGTGTNLYWPDSDSEKHLTYHPDDTIYQATRDQMNGTNPIDDGTYFRHVWNKLLGQIDDVVASYKARGSF
jgi:thymidylate synthase ThyX